ncbi:MAG: hypothetical protein AAF645_17080, partial [Myxococcota bacterium]
AAAAAAAFEESEPSSERAPAPSAPVEPRETQEAPSVDRPGEPEAVAFEPVEYGSETPALEAPRPSSRAERRDALRASNEARAPAPADDSEVALLNDALRHLQRERLNQAADALSEHARRFPASALDVERRGLRALLSCRRGDRSAATAFIEAHPRSQLVPRLQAACN